MSEHEDPDLGGTGRPNLRWASTQRTMAIVGTALSLLGLVAAKIGDQPGIDGYGFRVLAWVAALVLVVCCGINAWCWHTQIRRWRSGSDTGYPRSARLSLAAHVVSYVAVLVGMYGSLEGSALAGWGSRAGSLHGTAFILIIFGQIIGGTQLLRRSGPPGTIPTYVRKLNSKVQSLR